MLRDGEMILALVAAALAPAEWRNFLLVCATTLANSFLNETAIDKMQAFIRNHVFAC